MPATPDEPHTSPFEGLDYDPGVQPQTAQIGQLSLVVVQLTGVTGLLALAASVLLDQGRAAEALALLERDLAEREIEAQAKREERIAREARGGR